MSQASPDLVIELRAAHAPADRQDGEALVGAAPASLGPCLEDATFAGVVSGRLPNDGRAPQLEIEIRLATGSPDRVAWVALRHDREELARYPWSAFALQAHSLVDRLVAEKRIETGAEHRWSLHLRPSGARSRAGRVRSAPYPLCPAALDDRPLGGFDVAIEEKVLAARREKLLDGSGVESAALLLGRLYWDHERRAARLAVLDQIELGAGRGGASRTHFAFDADSFAAALEQARARRDLVIAGWVHDHPPCADCAKQPHCTSETLFFSTDDYAVHASAFPRAFQVALVAGKRGDRPAAQPGFRLYGWRRGSVEELPLRVLSRAAERHHTEER